MKEFIYYEVLKIEKELEKHYNNGFNSSLLSGLSGMPIFYLMLYKLTNEIKYKNKIYFFLERIFFVLNKKSISNFTYCNGLAGVAFMLNFLIKHKIINANDINESFEIFDDKISKFTLKNTNKIGDIDFLHGSLGTSYYLIDRIETESGLIDITTTIFEKIAKIVNEDIEKGKKSIKLLQKEAQPHYINCGMAHGYISIILVLSKFVKLFPTNNLLKNTLENSVRCILNYETPNIETLSTFPIQGINPRHANYNTPLGWCVGDQSISFGIFKASTVLNNTELNNKAIEIALKTLERNTLKKSSNSIEFLDASLCHGITGIAYLQKKTYQNTNDIQFLINYQNYTKELVQKAKKDSSLDIYKFYNKTSGFKEDHTLLNGLIGVGVFYIDYLLDNQYKNINWDKIFLLS